MSYIHESVIVPYYTNLHFEKTHYCVSDNNQHTRINHCYNWLLKTFLFLQKVFLRRMKTALLYLFVFSAPVVFAQGHIIQGGAIDVGKAPDTLMHNGEIIYLHPDENAAFPGGTAELVKYLSENIRFPSCGTGVNGKCYVDLIIQANGKIYDVIITRKVPDCPDCDKEAKRVVKNMPDWIPARKDGVAVASKFILPIRFCF